MTQVIGIDVGGSAIKLGRFAADGSCQKSLTVHTPQAVTPQEAIALIIDKIAEVDSRKEAIAIGVGTPGPADARGRIAQIAINLPGWRDVPLADALETATGKPTIVANDANCAGLGEAWLGAGRCFQNLILLTLGTGVGGAIILNNQLFVGHQGAAGELGLISFNPDGPQCKSGNRGSLEQYISATAIRRRTGKEPAELGALAAAGDSQALTFWLEYGKELGIGLTSLIYVLTPQAIIIGGGISGSAKFFLPSACREIAQRVMPTSQRGLKILPAELGNTAGMVGAAKLALNQLAVTSNQLPVTSNQLPVKEISKKVSSDQ